MSDRPVRPQRGDEHELFERYAERLHKATRLAIRTKPDIIDDACAFAWMKLVENQPRRETVFPWLKAVARNKALELHRLGRDQASRELSLQFNNGGRGAASREPRHAGGNPGTHRTARAIAAASAATT